MVGRPRQVVEDSPASWTKEALQAALRERGLSSFGTKAELLIRFEEFRGSRVVGTAAAPAGIAAPGAAASAQGGEPAAPVPAAGLAADKDAANATASARDVLAQALASQTPRPPATPAAMTRARPSAAAAPVTTTPAPAPPAAQPASARLHLAAAVRPVHMRPTPLSPLESPATEDASSDTPPAGVARGTTREPNFTIHEWVRLGLAHVMADPVNAPHIAAYDPRDTARREPWAAEGPLTAAFNSDAVGHAVDDGRLSCRGGAACRAAITAARLPARAASRADAAARRRPRLPRQCRCAPWARGAQAVTRRARSFAPKRSLNKTARRV